LQRARVAFLIQLRPHVAFAKHLFMCETRLVIAELGAELPVASSGAPRRTIPPIIQGRHCDASTLMNNRDAMWLMRASDEGPTHDRSVRLGAAGSNSEPPHGSAVGDARMAG
jgi:hypothetical protein